MHYIRLIFLCFLSSCAFQNLFVSQLDTFIEYRLNQQLDLYYQQKKEFSKDIDLWLNLQKKYVPEAQALLQKIDPEQTANIKSLLEEMSHLIKNSTNEFNILLISYLVKLDQKQIEHFFKEQEKANQELEVEISKMNLERLEDRAEFFLGDLTSDQSKLLKSYVPHWIERSQMRLKRRRLLHESLKSILHSTQVNKNEALNLAFSNYVTESFVFGDQVVNLLSSLTLTLNTDQKTHLKNKLKEAQNLLLVFKENTF